MGAEAVVSETCEMDSRTEADKFNESVVVSLQRILERYCQTRGGASNLTGDMISGLDVDGAAEVNAPLSSADENFPADNVVRLWEGEALSYYRMSAWEGLSS